MNKSCVVSSRFRARGGGLRALASVGFAMGSLASSGLANPFASEVVSYESGSGVQTGLNNPQAALGEPSRYISAGDFSGAVTPFNAPYQGSQIVSIGVGGSLVLKFDHPVLNDPQNPYGIDLIVFGNSFFYDPATFGPTANAIYGNRGKLEVSPDGDSWKTVTNFHPDGAFPTLAYNDVSDPYSSPEGASPTDFTRPVNPALDWHGLGLADLVAGYEGSGGGAGVDIGALGLSSITYVRFTLGEGETGAMNIDAIADVSPIPAPAGVVALGAGVLVLRRRGRTA